MYQIGQNCIIRTADGASIPSDPTNTDYQNYLQWAAAGNAADPAAPVMIAQARSIQAGAISAACQAAILSGFQSLALGSTYSYASTSVDQLNLQSTLAASAGSAAGWSAPIWCATGSTWALVSHTSAQLQQVNADWVAFRVVAQQKYATLISKINSAKTVSAVNAVSWS